MKRQLTAAGVLLFGIMGAVTSAHAIPLFGTFDVTIYQGTNTGGSINDPEEQANKANPLIAPANQVYTGSFTGALNFNPAANSLASFFAPVTLSPGLPGTNELSQPNFALTTVMVFTGTTGNQTLSGHIDHDDGISLFGGPGFNTPFTQSALPTSDIPSTYLGLSGPFELIYVEANGLPAVLDFEIDVASTTSPTPLPAGLPLFATGLGMLGLLARKRKQRKLAAL